MLCFTLHSCGRDRDWAWDRGCAAIVSKDSGYCQCTGGRTTKRYVKHKGPVQWLPARLCISSTSLTSMLWRYRMSCGRHTPFTCAAECDKLNDYPDDSLALPQNVSCPGQGMAQLPAVVLWVSRVAWALVDCVSCCFHAASLTSSRHIVNWHLFAPSAMPMSPVHKVAMGGIDPILSHCLARLSIFSVQLHNIVYFTSATLTWVQVQERCNKMLPANSFQNGEATSGTLMHKQPSYGGR